MRHIRVNISFTLDAIDADQMTLEQTPTRDQIANALTHSEGNHNHIAYRHPCSVLRRLQRSYALLLLLIRFTQFLQFVFREKMQCQRRLSAGMIARGRPLG